MSWDAENGDGDSSPWSRTRVPILLDSESSPTPLDSTRDLRTRFSGLGPDSANLQLS